MSKVEQSTVIDNYFCMDKKIMILDWDDTIYAHTFIKHTYITDELLLQMKKYTEAVIKFIQKCIDKGFIVVIITNAEELWVYQTCMKHMPDLFPLFENVIVFSAIDKYSHLTDKNDYVCWKYLTMLEVVNNYKPKYIFQIGDSLVEREALLLLCQLRPHIIYRSMKLVDRPHLNTLFSQIKQIAILLDEPLLESRDEMFNLVSMNNGNESNVI